ncbi:hypothetical protein, partial [Pseudomonas savastanoi]|uniref:hypothetical protein n=1 Tax=Pseudomonas savastanoi TaxID=29438 RepID=UPI0019681E28
MHPKDAEKGYLLTEMTVAIRGVFSGFGYLRPGQQGITSWLCTDNAHKKASGNLLRVNVRK